MRTLVLLLLTAFPLAVPLHAQQPLVDFRNEDHITIIGNTLADRMQHDGWLETLIQHRLPAKQLVFRNLAFPGDELDNRPRSENFGSPEQWLTKTETDVVFAFFGYNESFAGPAGVDAFKGKLRTFIDQTLAANYSGSGNARLVLFSPIAHENLKNRHLPDGSENNKRLALYTEAMREVAAEKKVPFVDLFTPMAARYLEAKKPLTMNGVHLNTDGNRVLAEVIDQALFGTGTAYSWDKLERMRQAVIDKNFAWFNLYRTVDGYNVFGGRSKLAWFGQSNADVMQREMEIFDVMAKNRDRRIWALAKGLDLTVDDSNTPPLLEVKTNKPGPLEDGRHPFLGGEEAIEKMDIAEGMQVNLFASEEQFPDLINPVQMAVDTDGRLWVATWPTYPHWNPKKPLADKILILPDDNADGKADRAIVFAEGLNSITGFEFWGGGVIVAAAPELLFLKDTDGDDRADLKIRMLQGISAEDTHHTANALTIGPDGGLYFSHGIFHVDNMETPTKTFRSTDSGVYRFDPRTYEISFHFPIGPNPHGIAFDQWGYQFASDGTSGTGNYISIGKGVGAPKQWYQKRVRPVPAIGFLSSSHFPSENNGNFLICNSIGFLGVLQHRVEYDGADINAIEIEPILVSADPNFRPTDVEVAGDGALYVSDWCNPLIGHMQHNVRDPNRDDSHGRVYRVTAKGRELLKPVKLKGKPVPEVLQALYGPENGTRYRARLELSGRDSAVVMAGVSEFVAKIKGSSPEDEQALLEALWVCEEHRVPNEKLLKRVAAAKDPRVRAAAIRTLGHWGSKVSDWQPLLASASKDREPLVRAEAVKAAIAFEGLAAADAFFAVSNQPTDVQLDFVLNYAKQQMDIDRTLREALAAGKTLSLDAQTYMLKSSSVADLLKMEPSEAVYQAILTRSNVAPETLSKTLDALSKLRKTSQVGLMLDLIEQQDANKDESNLGALGNLLVSQSQASLKTAASRLEKLAAAGQTPAARRAALAGWIIADGAGDNAFALASKQKDSLREFLQSIELVKDPSVLTSLYSIVQPLMSELPSHLQQEKGGASLAENGIRVDFYHPNPSNVAKETLERMKPKATGVVPKITIDVPQLSTRDEFALRFTGSITVEKTGEYTFATASDDGSRLYIGDELVVNNDGLHGMVKVQGTIELPAGSHPIMVTYFDNGGGDGFEVTWSGPGFSEQPIPTSALSVEADDTLHDIAVRALAEIPGYDAEKFNHLATLIKSGKTRASAIRAISTIAAEHRAPGAIGPLADNLVAFLSGIPAKYRTSAVAVDATNLAKSLAESMPKEKAAAILRSLENLDVRVIAVGTVSHRMIYDKEVIAVAAGKPVEFRFSNSDDMPHNFVIVTPGSLEEVGMLAEKTAETPDATARHFVPQSDKVLLGSRLLQPGESQALSFEAPAQPGVYPYVCTYPGHWRRMYGALYVVADLEAYEANPEAYLAANPLPVRDELLKLLNRNTEWKMEDFTESIAALASGKGAARSHEVGEHLFKMAACSSCHKMGGEGQALGPDLATLDAKMTLSDLVRDVIEPSWRINEKYVSNSLLLADGRVLTGLIVEETADAVKIIANPAAPDKPVTVPKDEIDERSVSKVSLMPQGVLNKFTQEEILDLIAYVYAKGKKDHKLFGGSHAGHSH